MVFLPSVSILSLAAAFWQGQAWHDRGLELHDSHRSDPRNANQGSAVLELGGASSVSIGSSATSATSNAAASLAKTFQVSFGGNMFSSLDAASRVLSSEQLVTVTGCTCLGQEFDLGNARNFEAAACGCINTAKREPCDKPVLARVPAGLQRGQWTDPHDKVDETEHLCGWASYYLQRFLKTSPFSVARYNDGEWMAMEMGDDRSGSGVCPGNVDGLPCGSTFTNRLRKTLDDPELVADTWPASNTAGITELLNKGFIYQSSWDFTRHVGPSKVANREDWSFKQQFWLNDIIHGLVREQPADLTAWMVVLGDKNRFRVPGVGPEWLGKMTNKIPFDDFVRIKPEMADEQEELQTVDFLEKEIQCRLNNGRACVANGLAVRSQSLLSLGRRSNASHVSQVFLLSASMMTNIVIADLYPKAKAAGAFLIDVGSGFDPLINDNRVRRRTGLQSQELYREPKDVEVRRLVRLMHHIREEYDRQNWPLPPRFTESKDDARRLIQSWVQ